ncbi:MAG: glycoside hydrolase family 108 protein [Hyphomicrobiales bacterium]|nr:glycoside hydrolase family 108 protein [Hyphomicrobiales bacterium]
MNRNFPRALPLVLKHEGGFVNHPKDPGGATNKGITLATFRRYVKANGIVSDLKKLTIEQAGTVYRRQYWDQVHGAELPDGVDYTVFDFAVNSGPSRAAKYLQSVLGVSKDGRIGPATIAAARKLPAGDIINRLCDARLAFMKRIKSKGKRLWDTFGRGWSRRVADVRKHALDMTQPSLAPVPVPKPKPKPDPLTERELAEKIDKDLQSFEPSKPPEKPKAGGDLGVAAGVGAALMGAGIYFREFFENLWGSIWPF